MKKLAIGLIVAVLAGAGIFVLARDDGQKELESAEVTQTDNTTTIAEEKTETGQEQAEAKEADVSYTDNGFEPGSLTVKAGTTITVRNDSSMDLQFSSDEHPAHRDNPELNAVVLGPGEDLTITVSTKGTWGVHNHLEPSHTGTLIVE